MKSFALIPFLLIFALAGCQTFSFRENTAHADEKGLHVIFYYDQTETDGSVHNYFDALLDVINHTSLHRKQVTIHSGKATDLSDRYHLNGCPALIVKKNGVTEIRIEGQQDQRTILKKLKKIFPSGTYKSRSQ
ncbi:MAG TPA: hypothetical protein VFK33_16990 [Bacillales bacterium]|nr:hypothetical protein [Bacillales bacterium]